MGVTNALAAALQVGQLRLGRAGGVGEACSASRRDDIIEDYRLQCCKRAVQHGPRCMSAGPRLISCKPGFPSCRNKQGAGHTNAFGVRQVSEAQEGLHLGDKAAAAGSEEAGCLMFGIAQLTEALKSVCGLPASQSARTWNWSLWASCYPSSGAGSAGSQPAQAVRQGRPRCQVCGAAAAVAGTAGSRAMQPVPPRKRARGRPPAGVDRTL